LKTPDTVFSRLGDVVFLLEYNEGHIIADFTLWTYTRLENLQDRLKRLAVMWGVFCIGGLFYGLKDKLFAEAKENSHKYEAHLRSGYDTS